MDSLEQHNITCQQLFKLHKLVCPDLLMTLAAMCGKEDEILMIVLAGLLLVLALMEPKRQEGIRVPASAAALLHGVLLLNDDRICENN